MRCSSFWGGLGRMDLIFLVALADGRIERSFGLSNHQILHLGQTS